MVLVNISNSHATKLSAQARTVIVSLLADCTVCMAAHSICFCMCMLDTLFEYPRTA